MSTRPFRFVHAGDLHLEQPVQGMAEIPDHLRRLLVDAPYQAARRMFDSVLAEEADFLILSGDVLDPEQSGPRGPLFLVEQFQRLAERHIPVYWAAGAVDPPDVWPTWATLPENVHLFSRVRPEELICQREGMPVARIIGLAMDRARPVAWDGFQADPLGQFTIGALHGDFDLPLLQGRAMHYWALGGRHARTTLATGPQIIHWPGTPQGRGPNELGAYGCTLVQVDADRSVKTSLLPVDVIRWHHERVVLEPGVRREDLQYLMTERLNRLMESAPGLPLLVSWTVVGSGPLWHELHRGKLGLTLLAALRGEQGPGTPAAWSLSLASEPASDPPAELYEQQSILGDFLRGVRHWQINSAEPIDLSPCLHERHLAGTLAGQVGLGDPSTRSRVLREAALLGVDLLTAEEVTS